MTNVKLPLRVEEFPTMWHLLDADGESLCGSKSRKPLDAICEAVNASRDVGRDAIPREPTNAMMQAGYKAYGGTMYSPLHEQGWGNSAIAIWKAMYDAALRDEKGKK